MTGLNTYQRVDGTPETFHVHQLNTLLTQLGNPGAVHAELASRLGYPTVEAFLEVNGGNLVQAATPSVEKTEVR